MQGYITLQYCVPWPWSVHAWIVTMLYTSTSTYIPTHMGGAHYTLLILLLMGLVYAGIAFIHYLSRIVIWHVVCLGGRRFPDIMSRLRSIQADITARDDHHHHHQPHQGYRQSVPVYRPPVTTTPRPRPVFMFDNKTSMDMDKSGYLLTLLLFGNINIYQGYVICHTL